MIYHITCEKFNSKDEEFVHEDDELDIVAESYVTRNFWGSDTPNELLNEEIEVTVDGKQFTVYLEPDVCVTAYEKVVE